MLSLVFVLFYFIVFSFLFFLYFIHFSCFFFASFFLGSYRDCLFNPVDRCVVSGVWVGFLCYMCMVGRLTMFYLYYRLAS